MHSKTKRRKTTAPSFPIFSKLRLPKGKGQRPLTADEETLLLMMLAKKSKAYAFDIDRLIPEGSFLQSITQHFKDSDVSYALPLFQLIMVSASWLVQNGASLNVKGIEPILPALTAFRLALFDFDQRYYRRVSRGCSARPVASLKADFSLRRTAASSRSRSWIETARVYSAPVNLPRTGVRSCGSGTKRLQFTETVILRAPTKRVGRSRPAAAASSGRCSGISSPEMWRFFEVVP